MQSNVRALVCAVVECVCMCVGYACACMCVSWRQEVWMNLDATGWKRARCQSVLMNLINSLVLCEQAALDFFFVCVDWFIIYDAFHIIFKAQWRTHKHTQDHNPVFYINFKLNHFLLLLRWRWRVSVCFSAASTSMNLMLHLLLYLDESLVNSPSTLCKRFRAFPLCYSSNSAGITLSHLFSRFFPFLFFRYFCIFFGFHTHAQNVFPDAPGLLFLSALHLFKTSYFIAIHYFWPFIGFSFVCINW